MKEKHHACGCITIKKDGIISFKNICDIHKQSKEYGWILIQHDTKTKRG